MAEALARRRRRARGRSISVSELGFPRDGLQCTTQMQNVSHFPLPSALSPRRKQSSQLSTFHEVDWAKIIPDRIYYWASDDDRDVYTQYGNHSIHKSEDGSHRSGGHGSQSRFKKSLYIHERTRLGPGTVHTGADSHATHHASRSTNRNRIRLIDLRALLHT